MQSNTDFIPKFAKEPTVVIGFGAMLAQDESIEKAKPIAVASRANSKAVTMGIWKYWE